jgi:circadian clock protein KaiC
LAGASGTGKTTFGFQFATQGVLDGESSIFCSLEESPVEIRSMAQSLGFDVSELEKKGLHLLSWIPENQSPDAFISALASQIEAVKPSRIVLDGLSTFEHLYSQEMYLIAKRLVNLIHTHGITSIFTILTDQQSGLNITSFGLSSIFHNIILLRYVEADAQLKRSMLILKMRASSHDQSILQFSILSKAGLKILGTMGEYQGIMSGIAQKVYQKYLNKEQKIVAKQIAEKEKRNARLKAQQKRIIEKEEHARLHRRRKRV